VSADAKQVLHDTMDGQKALSLSCKLGSTHLAFSHPSRLVRHLNAIVGVLLHVVTHLRQLSSRIISIGIVCIQAWVDGCQNRVKHSCL
jgi:hypothetical protein